MGETFRRISLNQRRKLSVSYSEFKNRKKSVFDSDCIPRFDPDDIRDCPNTASSRKISRPSFKMMEMETVRSKKMSKAYATLYNNGIQRNDAANTNMDANAFITNKKMILYQRFREGLAVLRNFLAKNEILIQLVIILPIILTSLYIIFIEKGQLVIPANTRKDALDN